MNAITLLKHLMKTRGYTLEWLRDKLGYKTISGVSERLRGNSMRVDNLIKFLDAMDCELIVRSTFKDPDSKKYLEWKITLEDADSIVTE